MCRRRRGALLLRQERIFGRELDVLGPTRAFGDPFAEGFELGRGEFLIAGRHESGFGGEIQTAVFGLLGNDNQHGAVAGVETQIAHGDIGTVTADAAQFENRLDVAHEVDPRGQGSGQQQRERDSAHRIIIRSLVFWFLRLRLWIALVACCQIGAAESPIAIKDVAVIDVITAAVHPHQTVVIAGGRIVSIGSNVPVRARVVNGRGKFLIPGLWDMHVHLWYKENQLPTFIAFGVTGVRDMGSDFDRTSAWRAAIETGQAIGPHIVTPGPAVNGEASDNDKLPVIVARTAPEARQAFDRLWNMNVDFIRVDSGLPRDSYAALAELARHWHLPIEGEIPSEVRAFEAIEARQASLEHLDGVMHAVSTDAEAIDFFNQCAVRDVSIAPTLVEWQRAGHQNDAELRSDPRLKYVPASIRRSWPELKPDDEAAEIRKRSEGIYRLVSLATRTRVRVLAGTDTGDPYTIPGATLDDELEQLVKAGMTPHQALAAATIEPARFFGWNQHMGTIEEGKVADLVLLEGNPLADIANVRRVAGVFSRGRYFSRADLDAILAEKPGARK